VVEPVAGRPVHDGETPSRTAHVTLIGPTWCTMPSFDAHADDAIEQCEPLHLEGFVAKRTDSRYEAGKRSVHWRKMKCSSWRERHAPLRHERL
jgi:ATP-dependent DNA ligase